MRSQQMQNCGTIKAVGGCLAGLQPPSQPIYVQQGSTLWPQAPSCCICPALWAAQPILHHSCSVFCFEGSEALGQGATGHKEPLWPVNGAAPWCDCVGVEPLAQCLCPHERLMCSFLPPELGAPFSGPS